MQFGSWSIPRGNRKCPGDGYTMKTSRMLLGLLAVGWIVLAGCKKSEPPVVHANVYFGVQVDLDKLDPEFSSAGPELGHSAQLIKRYYLYSEFPRAAAELERLANDPGLSESQRKLAAVLLEQTRQVIAKAPPPAEK
jgi:hypothetical protein